MLKSVVGGDHLHGGICLVIQLVQEAVLDRLLAPFLLGFVYVSDMFSVQSFGDTVVCLPVIPCLRH